MWCDIEGISVEHDPVSGSQSNGFCTSEPDPGWTGFWKNSIGSDVDIQTAWITAVNAKSEVFFRYKPDWIKYFDRSTGIGSDRITERKVWTGLGLQTSPICSTQEGIPSVVKIFVKYTFLFYASVCLHLIFGPLLTATHRWRNRGRRMGQGPPLLFLGGPGPPLFYLDVVSLSNTISIGSSDKVNHSMKKTLQNLAVFCRYYFSHAICNLAGFRNCLAKYTVHNLSPFYGLLTALVLLYSVARRCNTTQFFTKMVSFYKLVRIMGVVRSFSWGGTSGFFQKFSTGAKSGEICFWPFEIKKTAVFAEMFIFLPLFRHSYGCVQEKFVPHH